MSSAPFCLQGSNGNGLGTLYIVCVCVCVCVCVWLLKAFAGPASSTVAGLAVWAVNALVCLEMSGATWRSCVILGLEASRPSSWGGRSTAFYPAFVVTCLLRPVFL